MARDVLSLMDSWAGVGTKNAKSSLFVSLLAVEGGAEAPDLDVRAFLHGCVPWARKQPVSEPQLKRWAGTQTRSFQAQSWAGQPPLCTSRGT